MSPVILDLVRLYCLCDCTITASSLSGGLSALLRRTSQPQFGYYRSTPRDHLALLSLSHGTLRQPTLSESEFVGVSRACSVPTARRLADSPPGRKLNSHVRVHPLSTSLPISALLLCQWSVPS
jgi:hypothetical protein